MNRSFVVLLLIIPFFGVAQFKKPVLVISTGFNYGSISDFNNTQEIILSNRPSHNFAIGSRLFLKKYNVNFDCGIGLNSINPIFFIGKSNFSNSNTAATDIYSFLPPIYEFLKTYINIKRETKLLSNKKLELNLLYGFGIQYLPKIFSNLDWQVIEYNGTESTSYKFYFDEKIIRGVKQISNRNLIGTVYFGLKYNPLFLKKNWVNLEIFWNPSLNSGIYSNFELLLPNRQIIGTQSFKFSNYGINLLFTLPKIIVKP